MYCREFQLLGRGAVVGKYQSLAQQEEGKKNRKAIAPSTECAAPWQGEERPANAVVCVGFVCYWWSIRKLQHKKKRKPAAQ